MALDSEGKTLSEADRRPDIAKTAAENTIVDMSQQGYQ
jgi:hypothetical protein